MSEGREMTREAVKSSVEMALCNIDFEADNAGDQLREKASRLNVNLFGEGVGRKMDEAVVESTDPQTKRISREKLIDGLTAKIVG